MALIECPECGGKVQIKPLLVFIAVIHYINKKNKFNRYIIVRIVESQIVLKVNFVDIVESHL